MGSDLGRSKMMLIVDMQMFSLVEILIEPFHSLSNLGCASSNFRNWSNDY